MPPHPHAQALLGEHAGGGAPIVTGYPFEDEWYTDADGQERPAPATAAMLMWRRDSELMVELLRVALWRWFGYEAERFSRPTPAVLDPLSFDEDILIAEALAGDAAGGVVDWLEAAFDADLNGVDTERCHRILEKASGQVLEGLTLPRLRGLLTQGREAWQARPVEAQYSALMLDYMPVALGENGKMREIFLHWVAGFSVEEAPDVLGLWAADEKGGALCKAIVDELRGRGLWRVCAAGAPVSLVADWAAACTCLNLDWAQGGQKSPARRQRPGALAGLYQSLVGLPARALPYRSAETLMDRFFLRMLRETRAWPGRDAPKAGAVIYTGDAPE